MRIFDICSIMNVFKYLYSRSKAIRMSRVGYCWVVLSVTRYWYFYLTLKERVFELMRYFAGTNKILLSKSLVD